MEAYPIDIEPEQLVRWLKVEQENPKLRLRIAATQATELRPMPAREGDLLGDIERDDLSEVAAVATLEVKPPPGDHQWLITVTIEDEIGPRLPEDGDVLEGEEEIDLETFDREFIQSERGAASIAAEVDGPDGKGALNRLMNAVQSDLHRRP